ncbi:MAG TPA: hypothetical protein VFF56_01010 [Bacillota bacterium]|nr:hypothetical protein [Bacillota bacterium]
MLIGELQSSSDTAASSKRISSPKTKRLHHLLIEQIYGLPDRLAAYS